MKTIYTLPALIVLASCAGGAGSNNSSGECETGAAQLQAAVGMNPDDAIALVDTLPEHVQNMTIYSGSSEKPHMLPKGKIVLEHSTPNVVDALVNGGTVTKVYCNR